MDRSFWASLLSRHLDVGRAYLGVVMAFSRILGFSSISIVMFLLFLRRSEGYLSSLVLAVYGFFFFVCVCVLFCTCVGFTYFPCPLLARSPIVVTMPVLLIVLVLCLCFPFIFGFFHNSQNTR